MNRPHASRLPRTSLRTSRWANMMLVGALASGCKDAPTNAEQSSAKTSLKTREAPGPTLVPPARSPERMAAPPLPTPPPPALLASETLLQLEHSAYGVSLHLASDATYVLMPGALYRVAPDSNGDADRVAVVRLPLGNGAMVHGDEVFYVAEGVLHAAPLTGGTPRVVASLPGTPRQFVVSDVATAWILRDEGESKVEKLGKRGPVTLYTSPHPIHALTQLHDWLFFVLSGHPSEFRIIGVSLRDGKVQEGEPRFGRTPSQLVAAREYLYYYDRAGRGVRRLSASFQEDTLLGERTICSPLAVGERVVCAQVGGLVAIDEETGTAAPLVQEARGPITTLAVAQHRVAWVTDLGKAGLGVSGVSLPQ